jgi:hypothetical protein
VRLLQDTCQIKRDCADEDQEEKSDEKKPRGQGQVKKKQLRPVLSPTAKTNKLNTAIMTMTL